jgi:hypothetical protein
MLHKLIFIFSIKGGNDHDTGLFADISAQVRSRIQFYIQITCQPAYKLQKII